MTSLDVALDKNVHMLTHRGLLVTKNGFIRKELCVARPPTLNFFPLMSWARNLTQMLYFRNIALSGSRKCLKNFDIDVEESKNLYVGNM